MRAVKVLPRRAASLFARCIKAGFNLTVVRMLESYDSYVSMSNSLCSAKSKDIV